MNPNQDKEPTGEQSSKTSSENMGSTSAPSEGRTLIDSSMNGQDLMQSWNVRKKAWIMAIETNSISYYEAHTFRRFLKWPLTISNILFLTLLIAACYLAISIILHSSSIIGVFLAVAFGFVCVEISAHIKKYAEKIMLRERLWQWGRHLFDSWDELSGWVGKTNPNELDFLAGEPDSSWYPNPNGGGVPDTDYKPIP